jgi:SAM-dependent methyltransferase
VVAGSRIAGAAPDFVTWSTFSDDATFPLEMKDYYERHAPGYDNWYLGTGRFEHVERPGFHDELGAVIDLLRSLPPKRTVDVACGTGFLTRHLPGEVTGVDQSPSMLRIAKEAAPRARFVLADVPPLPFPDDAFERLFTGHFHCHLEGEVRAAFVEECRRVASELLVLDTGMAPTIQEGRPAEGMIERIATDGSRHTIFKRHYTPSGHAEELHGELLFGGEWFVLTRSTR